MSKRVLKEDGVRMMTKLMRFIFIALAVVAIIVGIVLKNIYVIITKNTLCGLHGAMKIL